MWVSAMAGLTSAKVSTVVLQTEDRHGRSARKADWRLKLTDMIGLT